MYSVAMSLSPNGGTGYRNDTTVITAVTVFHGPHRALCWIPTYLSERVRGCGGLALKSLNLAYRMFLFRFCVFSNCFSCAIVWCSFVSFDSRRDENEPTVCIFIDCSAHFYFMAAQC